MVKQVNNVDKELDGGTQTEIILEFDAPFWLSTVNLSSVCHKPSGPGDGPYFCYMYTLPGKNICCPSCTTWTALLQKSAMEQHSVLLHA